MKAGAASLSLPSHAGRGKRAVIVAAQWHDDIMTPLIEGAQAALRAHGMAPEDIAIVRVPGSFELPLGVQRAIRRLHARPPRLPGMVVALGCIIRGETPHFHYIARTVTEALMRLSLDHNIPIGYGLLTTETKEQALARSSPEHNKGREAAEAALAMSL